MPERLSSFRGVAVGRVIFSPLSFGSVSSFPYSPVRTSFINSSDTTAYEDDIPRSCFAVFISITDTLSFTITEYASFCCSSVIKEISTAERNFISPLSTIALNSSMSLFTLKSLATIDELIPYSSAVASLVVECSTGTSAFGFGLPFSIRYSSLYRSPTANACSP